MHSNLPLSRVYRRHKATGVRGESQAAGRRQAGGRQAAGRRQAGDRQAAGRRQAGW